DPTGSTCDTAHFALPDGRGRVLAGQDTMGVNGAANRITNAGSGCTGSTLGGAGCGQQNRTIAQTNLPNVALNTTIAAGAGSHSHQFIAGGPSVRLVETAAGGAGYAAGGGLNVDVTNTVTATLPSMSGTTDPLGSGTALATLPPLQVVTQIIKL